jgi:hypothetical protein
MKSIVLFALISFGMMLTGTFYLSGSSPPGYRTSMTCNDNKYIELFLPGPVTLADVIYNTSETIGNQITYKNTKQTLHIPLKIGDVVKQPLLVERSPGWQSYQS